MSTETINLLVAQNVQILEMIGKIESRLDRIESGLKRIGKIEFRLDRIESNIKSLNHNIVRIAKWVSIDHRELSSIT